MTGKVRVRFVRLNITAHDVVEKELIKLYAEGWRVVSHTETDDDYTFVLEKHDS